MDRRTTNSIGENDLWDFDEPANKVYVAAPISQQGRASKMALRLIDAGFEVTSRWLREDFDDAPEKNNWFKYRNHQTKWGEVDLADCMAADTLVVFGNEPSTSGGYHVELGIFLGAGKKNVVAVGDRPNVFFHTGNVRFVKNEVDLIRWLRIQKLVKVTRRVEIEEWPEEQAVS